MKVSIWLSNSLHFVLMHFAFRTWTWHDKCEETKKKWARESTLLFLIEKSIEKRNMRILWTFRSLLPPLPPPPHIFDIKYFTKSRYENQIIMHKIYLTCFDCFSLFFPSLCQFIFMILCISIFLLLKLFQLFYLFICIFGSPSVFIMIDTKIKRSI